MLKKSLATLITIATSVICTLMIVGTMIPTQAGAPADPVCGDVNGDGAVLLNDAIALLNHLFVPGSPDLACAQGPSGITAGELDMVLAEFFRRQRDIEALEVVIPPGQSVDVVSVDAGRRFMLTFVEMLNLNSGVFGMAGDVGFNNQTWHPIDQSNRKSREYESNIFPVEPGETLTITNENPTQQTVRLHGYWIDL